MRNPIRGIIDEALRKAGGHPPHALRGRRYNLTAAPAGLRSRRVSRTSALVLAITTGPTEPL